MSDKDPAFDFTDKRSVPTIVGPIIGQAGGIKHDQAKPPMELLSPIALEGTALVLAFGKGKYAAHNWRKGIEWDRLIGAAMRHLLAFNRGEDLDPESGLPHVDHFACCAMFLQEEFRTRKDLDTRWKPPTP